MSGRRAVRRADRPARRSTPSPSRAPGRTSRGRATTSRRSAEKIFCFLGDDGDRGQAAAPGPRPTSGSPSTPTTPVVMAYIGRHGWNTLRVGGAIPEATLREAIDTSYDLVVAKLPKSKRPRT